MNAIAGVFGTFRGAQLLNTINREIPDPVPTVIVNLTKPYLTCAQGYKPYLGLLGTRVHEPLTFGTGRKRKNVRPVSGLNQLEWIPQHGRWAAYGGGLMHQRWQDVELNPYDPPNPTKARHSRPKLVMHFDEQLSVAMLRSIVDEQGKRIVDPLMTHVVVLFMQASDKRFKGILRDTDKVYQPREDDRGFPVREELNGVPVYPQRHGVTGWIRSQNRPELGQKIKVRFISGDVVKSDLHRDEVKELEKSRWLTVKGNTGGWRPLRANENFVEWSQKDGSVDDRSITDQFKPTLCFEVRNEEQAEGHELRAMRSERPGVIFDGEEFTFADVDRPEYIPCQIETRGRGRNKTDDERIQDRAEEARRRANIQPIAQTIIKNGGCTSADGMKNTFEYHGVKIDPSSITFKHIKYEFDILSGNYDTKEKLGGEHYESFRKKELEEYVVNAKEIPATKFTKEQTEDITENDGRVVYAHIILDRGRWFKLAMDKHETYEAALHEVWSKSIEEAFKKAGVISRTKGTNAENPEWNQAFKQVCFRFEKAFRPENIYIMDWRTPTVRAIAQATWEARNAA